MDEAQELVEEARGLLARAALLPPTLLTDEQAGSLVVAIEDVGRVVDGMRAVNAADIDFRSRYELGTDGMSRRLGFTRGSHLIEHLTRISSADATRRIRLGKDIMPRMGFAGAVLPPTQPLIAVAVTEGKIGVDAARHLARLVDRIKKTTKDVVIVDLITDLIHVGGDLSTDLLGVQVRQWESVLDNDGIEPRDDQLRARRRFVLGREADGITPFFGSLDPTSAGTLRAIFKEAEMAATAPDLDETDRLRGTETITAEDGTTTVIESDLRTPPQRNMDVLMGVLKAGLRASAAETGSMRPTTTVSIHVSLADLQSGTGAGWIDGVDEPVSVASVREALCDGEYSKVLLGDHGEVLYVGRTQRMFSRAQRRGLAARDGGCLWFNCGEPPRRCDAHHVKEYKKDGGPTDIDNGVLLCNAHHHYLHHSDFTIKMINGVPHVLAPPWIDQSQTWNPMSKSRVRGVNELRPMLADRDVTLGCYVRNSTLTAPKSSGVCLSRSTRSAERTRVVMGPFPVTGYASSHLACRVVTGRVDLPQRGPDLSPGMFVMATATAAAGESEMTRTCRVHPRRRRIGTRALRSRSAIGTSP